jgi:hypothetical protein
MMSFRAPPRRPVVAVLTVLSFSCSQIVGVGEYSTGEPCATGTVKREGRCVLATSCGPLQVPDGEGCADVGVPPEVCGDRFEPDDAGGCRAILPREECEFLSVAQGATATCRSNPFGCGEGDFPAVPPGSSPVVYVRQGAATSDAAGTEASPWPTLGEGLAHAEPGGVVLVAGGVYREDVVLEVPGVRVLGCAGGVTIEGTGERGDPGDACVAVGGGPRPAICVTGAASGVVLEALVVTGPADGVAVVGDAEATLRSTRVRETGRYGVRIEKSAATLDGSQVEKARGVGIYAAGATLEVFNSVVLGTEPIVEGGWARGISVHPSGDPYPYLEVEPVDGFRPTRSTATIRRSTIAGNAEAGIWLAGTESAEVTATYVGDLPWLGGNGLGIVVEQALPSGAPAAATLDGLVIEHARDAGVEVHNAVVVVKNTTIRTTLPRTSDGCSGQGVRVRSDPGETAEVTIERSTITESRQAAVQALGSRVTIDSSILRGSAAGDVPDACAPAFGDGLNVESASNGLAATATVARSRIEHNERAGITAAWAELDVSGSVLDCNGRGIVAAGGSAGAVSAFCGRGEGLEACAVEEDQLPSWLALPTDGIWAEGTAPLEGRAWDGHGNFPLPETRTWVVDRPEIPAAAAGNDGRWRLDGAPSTGEVLRAVWTPGRTLAATHAPAPAAANVFGATMWPDYRTYPLGIWGAFDVNKALLWVGVPAGHRVRSSRGTLVYLTERLTPDPSLDRASAGGVAVAANLEPGFIEITLEPPDGATCELNSWSGLVAGPASLRAKLLPGASNVIAFACR